MKYPRMCYVLLAISLSLAGGAEAGSLILNLAWKHGLCSVDRQNSLCHVADTPASRQFASRNLTVDFLGISDQPCLAGARANAALPPLLGAEWARRDPRQIWQQHGQCSQMTPKVYFQQASLYALQVRQSEFGQYLQRHVGQRVKRAVLMTRLQGVELTMPDLPARLQCQSGVLTSVVFYPPDPSSLLEPSNGTLPAAVQDGCAEDVLL